MCEVDVDQEGQRFMAHWGLRQWGDGVLRQVARMEAEIARFEGRDYPVAKATFECERLYFLIAANKVVEYIKWARELAFLPEDAFAEIDKLAGDIKTVRGLNEHVIEYFKGPGMYPQEWTRADEIAIADASSTVGSKIGNRLDWNEVARAVQHMLDRLPQRHQRQESPPAP